MSNICDEAFFAKIVNSTQGLTISAKKLHYRCLKNPKYISRSQMFFKIAVPKNFANLIEKKLCWRLFLIKLQAWALQLYLKGASTQVFSYEVCEILRTPFFIEHLRWLLFDLGLQKNINCLKKFKISVNSYVL